MKGLTLEEFEELKVGGLMINYLLICPRKLWLYSRGIRMEQTSEKVELGEILHQSSYERSSAKELLIEDLIKVDVILEKRRITEVKYSSKMHEATRAQLAYYLYFFKKRGVILKGEIRFPKEKRKEIVELDEKTEEFVENCLRKVWEVLKSDKVPPAERGKICRSCSYELLCWG
ncbi:MAG: CRISPR-associated protein Cas4 [bacterium]